MPTHYRLAMAFLLALLPYTAGCGADLPAQHPVGDLSSRASARVGLISLIIKDKAKAKKVIALHSELVELAPRFNRKRAVLIAGLVTLMEESPERFKAQTMEARREEVKTYARYRQLMLELRTLVDPQEYKRLMAIR